MFRQHVVHTYCTIKVLFMQRYITIKTVLYDMIFVFLEYILNESFFPIQAIQLYHNRAKNDVDVQLLYKLKEEIILIVKSTIQKISLRSDNHPAPMHFEVMPLLP